MTTLTFYVEAVSITKQRVEIVASTTKGDEVSLIAKTIGDVVLPKIGSELTVRFGPEAAE